MRLLVRGAEPIAKDVELVLLRHRLSVLALGGSDRGFGAPTVR